MLGLAGWTNASPLISAGDARTRHHLSVLTQSNMLHIPTTSWPIPWAAVKLELDAIDKMGNLTEQQLWSINYLQHELEKNSQKIYMRGESTLAGEYAIDNGFQSPMRDKRSIGVSAVGTFESLAGNISATYVDDPIDGKDWQFDRSFIAAALGNWGIGIGAIDRWWGPGWQNSLALSNAARPAPGLFINRLSSEPVPWPILEKIGPWHATAFVNELQDSPDDIDNAFLSGWRMTISPIPGLELGAANTMIWSRWYQSETSEPQPNPGNDQPASMDDSDNSMSQQPRIKTSHQRTGDIRYERAFGALSGGIYGQHSQQRQRNGAELQSELFGIDINFTVANMQSRLAIETTSSDEAISSNDEISSDDEIALNDDSLLTNSDNNSSAYDAHLGGYRHYGVSLGAASAGETESTHLVGLHFLANGHNIQWQLGRLKFSNDQDSVTSATLRYQLPISDKTLLELGANHYSATLPHPTSGWLSEREMDLSSENPETPISENLEIRSGAFLIVHHHW